jgi:hypothetical protein
VSLVYSYQDDAISDRHRCPSRVESHTPSQPIISETNLLDKGTATSIDHKDIWGWPSLTVFGLGVSLGSIHIGVTQIRVGIIETLCNCPSVRWYTKQRLTMFVSILLEQGLRDLYMYNEDKRCKARLCQNAMTKYYRSNLWKSHV